MNKHPHKRLHSLVMQDVNDTEDEHDEGAQSSDTDSSSVDCDQRENISYHTDCCTESDSDDI